MWQTVRTATNFLPLVWLLSLIFSSGMTALATFFLTKELWSTGAGLFAACFIAIGKFLPAHLLYKVPGNIFIFVRNSVVFVLFWVWKISVWSLFPETIGCPFLWKFTGAYGFLSCVAVPGYISRSVAGSYDNEGIAIFALMFTYYLWVSHQQNWHFAPDDNFWAFRKNWLQLIWTIGAFYGCLNFVLRLSLFCCR